jgi:hypothetical protein
MELPVDYEELTWQERREVRQQYVREPQGLCWHCKETLSKDAPEKIRSMRINWDLFPPQFLKYPIHLQHDHDTGLTEGAVHAYCNAVLWQYHGA